MILSFLLLIISYTFVAANLDNIHEYDNDCRLYLALSTFHGTGRGIIAGINFDENDLIDDNALTITIPSNFIFNSSLNNYVYCSEEDDHSLLVFGIGMLFNHISDENKHKMTLEWSDTYVSLVSQQYESHSTMTGVTHYVTTNNIINKGEEIFIFYGNDEWFEDRNISIILDNNVNEKNHKLSDEYLLTNGYCMTNVYLDKSDIPLAGKGLYANKNFIKGDIILISPTLLLSKQAVVNINNDSILMNYCFESSVISNNTNYLECNNGINENDEDDVLILPIGYSAGINHAKKTDANVIIDWFDFPNLITDLTLNSSFEDLLSAPFSQLDIKIIATRDIKVDEELTLFYGDKWIDSWTKHLANLVIYLRENDKNSKNYIKNMPKFRHSMGAPNDFIPSHWMEKTNNSYINKKYTVSSSSCSSSNIINKNQNCDLGYESILNNNNNNKSYKIENFIQHYFIFLCFVITVIFLFVLYSIIPLFRGRGNHSNSDYLDRKMLD